MQSIFAADSMDRLLLLSMQWFSKNTCKRSNHTCAKNRISHKMAIQGHVFWGQWKGDMGLNNTRVVVSVSTSRSRDGLETYFSNVSVSSRSRQSVGRSWSRSRLGLKAKRLGLVSVSGHNVSFTSVHLNIFFSFFHFRTKQTWAIFSFHA